MLAASSLARRGRSYDEPTLSTTVAAKLAGNATSTARLVLIQNSPATSKRSMPQRSRADMRSVTKYVLSTR